MKISQREARRLRKRVDELQRAISTRRNAWVSDYPGGAHLGSVAMSGDNDEIELFGQIKAARKLSHAVVVTLDTGGRNVRFFALPEADV